MMKTFKDARGREWRLQLTLATVKRIQERHGVNIADADDFLRLHNDFALFGAVIATLLQPQFTEQQITAEDLEEAMDGDALAAARDAMLEELTFFSPNREAAQKALPAVRKRQQKLMADLVEKIERGEMDNQLLPRGLPGSGKPSTSSPAPPPSPTPDR
jgi:hypothetical protein